MLTKSDRRKNSAGKKVTIDREAYMRLEQSRTAGETLSDVIKRYIRPKQTAEDVLRAMRSAKISDATIQAINESAARRRQIPHRSTG
jgi:predicted CopG family antitoxin